MAERGFFGVEVKPGETAFDVDESEQVLFEAAGLRCVEAMRRDGLIPASAPPLTRESLIDRRDFLIEAAACLEALGFEISDPPSIDFFVDTLGESWTPHGEILFLSPEDFDKAEAICPQG